MILWNMLFDNFFSEDIVSGWCSNDLGDIMISGLCIGCIIWWCSILNICVGVEGIYIC